MKNISFLLLFFLCISLRAQKQANNWHFGEKIGITFENNRPEIVFSNIEAIGSTSSISDPESGKLLFYTNGSSVWNSSHQYMKNGIGLNGDSTASQAALIVPFYEDENKYYYLFTLNATNPEITGSSELYYSIIDMNLENGLGDIIESKKNIFLEDSLTEKMTAVRHANNQDFWIILHEINSNAFLIYLLTDSGVSFHDKISIGAIHPSTTFDINGGTGQLKASPNGSKLAITQFSDFAEVPFEMFQFDRNTGLIYGATHLGNFISQYGVSFSPDNSKLYLDGICLSCPEETDFLYQFDLEETNVAESRVGLLINNPDFNIFDFTNSFASIALQNAPDGKIYSAGSGRDNSNHNFSDNLLIINRPNAKGLEVNIELKEIDFERGIVRNGLPNFIEDVFNGLTPNENPNVPCTAELVKIYPNPTFNYLSIDLSDNCFRPYNLTIFNVKGQRVYNSYLETDTLNKLDITNLASGVYNVIIDLDGYIFTKRFVKLNYDQTESY